MTDQQQAEKLLKQIAELRTLAAKATPGPYTVSCRGGGMGYDIDPMPAGVRGMLDKDADAELIAVALNSLRSLLDAAETWRKECDRRYEENTRLRTALANSELPCAYCVLPAEKWAECTSGFPGCARGDDAMGCPELGAAMRLQSLLGAGDTVPEWCGAAASECRDMDIMMPDYEPRLAAIIARHLRGEK